MLLKDFLNDRRFRKLLEDYWHVEFSFNDKSFEQSHYYELVVLGKPFDEYYLEDVPFNHYYKKFGNLCKKISVRDKEKEVTKIKVGCSGRKFECVLHLDVEEHDTLDKVFNVFK